MSAAASYWRNAVRHPEDCGVGNIRRTFDYTEFGNLAGDYPAYALPIGCLEKGAVPLRISTRVQTAVTGGTPAVTIGTSTDPDAFAVAADIAAGSTGYKTAATGSEMGKALAADTMFFAYISASAATGKFTITVEFANKREAAPEIEETEDEEEGGGSSAPAWVPEGAVIHIDLVGGTPQGRAWVDGTGEVDVDTLLGTDEIVDSSWGAPSFFDPTWLLVDGYDPNASDPTTIAFIGAARTMLLDEATVVVTTKQTGDSNNGVPLGLTVDGGSLLLTIEVGVDLNVLSDSGLDTVTGVASLAVGSTTRTAATVAATRLEAAVNGSAVGSVTLTTSDRPPANPMVGVLVDFSGEPVLVQSITIYDPLPSTAGLSELSES